MPSKKMIGLMAMAVAAVGGGGLAGAVVGAPVVSSAQSAEEESETSVVAGDDTTVATSDETSEDDDADESQSQRSDEELLTGDIAAQVTAAAQAAVPDGEVLRVETDSDGSPYEAHVRKADGTEVVVKIDANFAVTSIEEHGGRGGRGGHDKTPLADDIAAQVTAAAQAAVPDGEVLKISEGRDTAYEAHVRQADGTVVEVAIDEAFAVVSIEEHEGRGGHGGRHHDDDAETDEEPTATTAAA